MHLINSDYCLGYYLFFLQDILQEFVIQHFPLNNEFCLILSLLSNQFLCFEIKYILWFHFHKIQPISQSIFSCLATDPVHVVISFSASLLQKVPSFRREIKIAYTVIVIAIVVVQVSSSLSYYFQTDFPLIINILNFKNELSLKTI